MPLSKTGRFITFQAAILMLITALLEVLKWVLTTQYSATTGRYLRVGRVVPAVYLLPMGEFLPAFYSAILCPAMFCFVVLACDVESAPGLPGR